VAEETVTIEAQALPATSRDLARRVVDLLGSEEQFGLYADDIPTMSHPSPKPTKRRTS